MEWTIELFKCGCVCLTVGAALAFAVYVLVDDFTSWRGGYDYMDGAMQFFMVVCVAIVIFGSYVLLFAW